MSRMPRAIAPEVTSTTESPSRCRTATCSETEASTSSRTSPRWSATMLDPSFTTVVLISAKVMCAADGSAKRSRRVELEDHSADLHVVARGEARSLERDDHPDCPEAVLDVRQRLLVL